MKLPPTYHSIAKTGRRVGGVGRFAYLLACLGSLSPVMYALGARAPQFALKTLSLCLSAILMGLSALAVLLAIWVISMNTNRERRDRKNNYALSALILGIGGLFISLTASSYIDASGRYGERISCLSNVKQIEIGLLMYSQDADDRLPLPTYWQHDLYPYLKNEQLYHCPKALSAQPAYALNGDIAAVSLGSVQTTDLTVMTFDSVPGTSLHGGRELLPEPPRHNGGHNIGLADGHVKWYTAGNVGSLVWTPKMVANPGLTNNQ